MENQHTYHWFYIDNSIGMVVHVILILRSFSRWAIGLGTRVVHCFILLGEINKTRNTATALQGAHLMLCVLMETQSSWKVTLMNYRLVAVLNGL